MQKIFCYFSFYSIQFQIEKNFMKFFILFYIFFRVFSSKLIYFQQVGYRFLIQPQTAQSGWQVGFQDAFHVDFKYRFNYNLLIIIFNWIIKQFKLISTIKRFLFIDGQAAYPINQLINQLSNQSFIHSINQSMIAIYQCEFLSLIIFIYFFNSI
ncbi:transmembrane protein, putative (macronuclear) [Tetrahymena thermophila SB210]|uniref:Transmembrane protein, putative n=1 Tax=Tetrahymena thermophila (strain SB210) TaxID=312017 RepID=W7XEH8_TETTS|nr:transmembrane protein, putative [Tetrahymena thermophila SB210]EWS75073.1 transmembrane protein, putative [Tetrahymena thermophila SB210]|eukprot:XP_012652386.1 transmembrane protein, putative [Tetrahymena thermophila SB210]